MSNASLNEIKKELGQLDGKVLTDLCLRLARYKKENKELLGFLLFNGNADDFLANVKAEIREEIFPLTSNPYQAKKVLRKALKLVTKYCKFSQSKLFETEIRIYFCELVIESGIAINRYPQIKNLYIQQIKYIQKSKNALHEDLQFDFEEPWERISTGYDISLK